MLVGTGLPNQLAGGSVDGVKVGDDVAEIGCGGAIWPAFAEGNAGANFSTGSIGQRTQPVSRSKA